MHEKMNDKIDVLVRFSGSKIEPAIFKWGGRSYQVEKINMIHKERDGGDKIYYFSVSDNANFFRLAFFTRDLSWRLQEVFAL